MARFKVRVSLSGLLLKIKIGEMKTKKKELLMSHLRPS
jgi:hypothetical protein